MALLTPVYAPITGTDTQFAIIVWTGERMEPVACDGPFVMNTNAEIRKAFIDFDHGRFGMPLPD